MNRETHVRFWERAAVKARRATRLVIFSAQHLRRVLLSYIAYYHRSRTHLALDKDYPDGRPIQPPTAGTISAFPEVGGLHYRYQRLAA